MSRSGGINFKLLTVGSLLVAASAMILWYKNYERTYVLDSTTIQTAFYQGTRDSLRKRPAIPADYTAEHAPVRARGLDRICTAPVGASELSCASGEVRLYAKIIRAMRYRNITALAERYYGLPRNMLTAMIMHESFGDITVPNSTYDGGIGLCHMQGVVAEEYGLRTLCDDTCGIVCKVHGNALRNAVAEHRNNLAELIKIDERFNPVLNIDAAARILAYHYRTPDYKALSSAGRVEKAIMGYAGRVNFENYWQRVLYYQKQLNDPLIMKRIRKYFNAKNAELSIYREKAGRYKRADFDLFLKVNFEQNYNYGLAAYEQQCGYTVSAMNEGDDRIKIKYFYKVRRGDTLDKIAKKFAVSKEDLRDLNPDDITDDFQISYDSELLIDLVRIS